MPESSQKWLPVLARNFGVKFPTFSAVLDALVPGCKFRCGWPVSFRPTQMGLCNFGPVWSLLTMAPHHPRIPRKERLLCLSEVGSRIGAWEKPHKTAENLLDSHVSVGHPAGVPTKSAPFCMEIRKMVQKYDFPLMSYFGLFFSWSSFRDLFQDLFVFLLRDVHSSKRSALQRNRTVQVHSFRQERAKRKSSQRILERAKLPRLVCGRGGWCCPYQGLSRCDMCW